MAPRRPAARSKRHEKQGGESSWPRKSLHMRVQRRRDAVAGWLGSYGGEDSPCDISRGMFSGEVGSPPVRLFERFGIKTTWFIPAHSIETFPEQMKAVAEAGHEIGMHGYSHEPDRHDARAGGGDLRQVHRVHRRLVR